MNTPKTKAGPAWVFNEYGIPYDYISVHGVYKDACLRESYDVIVMGHQRGDAMTLVRGLQGDEPIPWKATEITPNIGHPASTGNMRGGVGLEGVLSSPGPSSKRAAYSSRWPGVAASNPLRPGRRRGHPADAWTLGAAAYSLRGSPTRKARSRTGYDDLGWPSIPLPCSEWAVGTAVSVPSLAVPGAAAIKTARSGRHCYEAHRPRRSGRAGRGAGEGPGTWGAAGVETFRETQESDDETPTADSPSLLRRITSEWSCGWRPPPPTC